MFRLQSLAKCITACTLMTELNGLFAPSGGEWDLEKAIMSPLYEMVFVANRMRSAGR